MNYKIAILRFVGLLLLAAGVVLWWQGGFSIPVEYREFAVLLPLHYALLFLGILSIANPLLVIIAAASILGERGKPLLEWVTKFQAEPLEMPDDSSPESVARYVRKFADRANRRYYLTVLTICLFVFLVLPFLVADLIAKSNFNRQSRRLVSLVQGVRLSFSNADVYREQIRDAEGSLDTHLGGGSATHEIHAILKTLYSASVVDVASFEEQVNKQYEEKVKSKLMPDFSLVKKDGLAVPFSTALEEPSARITLLTLIALICNEQGNQGAYVDPYLQGRQFLQHALEEAESLKLRLPTTHNALGVNYAETLRCYGQYEEKFKDKQSTTAMSAALNEAKPIAPLTLARLATEQYQAAVDSSTSNYATARYLNNKVDLKKELLTQLHLRGVVLKGVDKIDEEYLANDLGWSRAGPSLHLQDILSGLLRDMDRAIALAQTPNIYFTRAELYCLGGRLSDKYKFDHGIWSNKTDLATKAMADLRTASSMNLPKRFFSAERTAQFGVDWLSSVPGFETALAELGR